MELLDDLDDANADSCGGSEDLQEYDKDDNDSLDIESNDGGLDTGIDEIEVSPIGQLSIVPAMLKTTKAKWPAAPAVSCSKKTGAAPVVDKDSDTSSADLGEVSYG